MKKVNQATVFGPAIPSQPWCVTKERRVRSGHVGLVRGNERNRRVCLCYEDEPCIRCGACQVRSGLPDCY